MLKISNCEISHISTQKDHGIKITILTPELTAEEAAFLFAYKQEGVVNSISIE